MACEYVLLEGARAEIDATLAYLLEAADGPRAADRFLDELVRQIERACDNPTMFALSRMPELAVLGYRSMLVGDYVILYFVRDGLVFIAHLFHQRQDYASLV